LYSRKETSKIGFAIKEKGDTIELVVESGSIVATLLNINEALLQEALELDDQTTIDTLVETALRVYIQHRKRLKVIDLFGTIDYDEGYDYKQQRQQT
jgi:Bacterial antitoxin of type II TA system, VapB